MSHWESNGKSDDWYTPKYIFDALSCEFDLDVAGPCNFNTYVPYFSVITQDSLQKNWFGFIWMNPPYGGRNGLEPWLEKFIIHNNGIALVPDRTSAPWFQKFYPLMDLVMFIPKVRFIRPDGSLGENPSNGTALMGLGNKAAKALNNAYINKLGILSKPL